MTRRVYNIVVDESGKPIDGVEVHVSLNRTTYKGTIEVAKYGVLAKTDKRGYWEISLHANDTLDDPNSFYTVEEIKNGKRIATHYIRVPSSETYTEPIHIKQIEITPLPTTPPPNVVTGIAADNNIFLRGDVRLLSGSGIQLQQDNVAKTITIINTGGGGGGGGGSGGSSPHNLLDGSVHTDTEAVNVQRGMLIVGKLTGAGVKWSGLPIGLSGRFLKSTGIDVVWSNIDWTDIQNRPSTFPPSPHTHDAADIISGRLSTSRLPTSPNANRFLVVRTANSDPIYDTIQASDLPSHTHTPSQISPQGSGSGLDADTVDGQHASAFAPASHTHSASDITSGRLSASRLPTSSTANRFLVVRTANSDPVYDAIQATDLPAHTHSPSQISPQGSGSGLDADKLDGLDSTAFERVSNKGVANGYAPLDASAKVPTTHIADNLRIATIGLTVGDGVNVITTGFKGAIPVPFSGTITEWTIVSTDANPPTSGSIQIDILKSTFANYPTMSSMVGTGTKPNIANSNKGTGTTTGWSTTTINAGDIIGFNVVSVTGLKRITIVLKVVKS
jgi:hypothetical protein